MNKDLTSGKPDTVLWRFCIPLFGSIVFQQLYNIADSLIAGRYISENALASVGNAYQITLLFLAFAFGCNIGCSVIVSRFFGAKEYGKMKTAVFTTWVSSAVLCGVLMFAGIVFCKPILELIRTPESMFSDSSLYLNIYVYGLPFLLFYNVATGIFSALGDSKTPFIFLAFSSVANILMDIWFVKYFEMGVAGLGWATFICQGVSCLLSVIVVIKRLAGVKTEDKGHIFSLRIFKMIIAISIPSILQQAFISAGNIILQGTINDFGESTIAGYSAAIKLNNLVISSYTTIGNGISNYASQNFGAGKFERLTPGFKAGIKIIWTITLPFMVIYLLFARQLVGFFMDNPSEAAISTGVTFLYIVVPFYVIVSTKLIADGILRGMGLMKRFMVTTFTDLILRVGLAIVFAKLFGEIGIWCAWPVGWIIATSMSQIMQWQAVKKIQRRQK